MSNYIVLVSPSYGGAEKRFFDIFSGLVLQGKDFYIVAPTPLYEKFRADHSELREILARIIEIPLPVWSPLRFILSFRDFLKRQPKGGCYHYPLNCLWPLHIGRGDRVSLTVADCTICPSFFSVNKTAFWTRLCFMFVRRVDVLSPQIFNKLNKRRGLFLLTPGGTYLKPVNISASKKFSEVVLMSRLVTGKGILEFLEIVPSLWGLIKGRVASDFCFHIVGYGALSDYVERCVANLSASSVPIKFKGYVAAGEALEHAAVVLSLQEVTNYPSRVIPEALTSGCSVIVRNVGDSQLFGDKIPGLIYCSAVLSADELADLIVRQLHKILNEENYVREIQEFSRNRFCSDDYLVYFERLMAT